MSQTAETEQSSAPQQRNGQRSPGGKGEGRPAGRKIAEWVTLGLSFLLVGGVAVFLVVQAMNEESLFIESEVKVRQDLAVERGGKHVVPVEVQNLGRRTLKDFKIRVTYRTASGQRESEDLVVDYLGERASATLYLYLDRDPQEAQVEARAFGYRLE